MWVDQRLVQDNIDIAWERGQYPDIAWERGQYPDIAWEGGFSYVFLIHTLIQPFISRLLQ